MVVMVVVVVVVVVFSQQWSCSGDEVSGNDGRHRPTIAMAVT